MTKPNDHTARAHALLSASSSGRWLNCPPSAVIASAYPAQDTVFTREGTLAHEVAEYIARQSGTVSLDAFKDWPQAEEITNEMISCAEGYRDYIQGLIEDPAAVVLLEQRLDYSPWVPGGFGTGDCLILQNRTLHVVDYKFGRGVVVTAVKNSQMRLYGLGAWNAFNFIYDIDAVVTHIFQPRLNNTSVEQLTVEDLLAWGESIKPVAVQASSGEGEFCAGEHCRFCPHAGACPSLAQHCTQAYQVSGGEITVATLQPWQIADIMGQEPIITAWLQAVKNRALASLMNGGEIPGYKVVEGRPGNRKWKSEKKVIEVLAAAGLTEDDYYEQKLRTPSGLDKALGKKRAAELVGSLISRAPGAPTVVRAMDSRPDYNSTEAARQEFLNG